MKRTNKLYEAIAIVSHMGNSLPMKLHSLNFNKSIRSKLIPQLRAAMKELSNLEKELELILEEETGLTEQIKWANAAKNIGGAK